MNASTRTAVPVSAWPPVVASRSLLLVFCTHVGSHFYRLSFVTFTHRPTVFGSGAEMWTVVQDGRRHTFSEVDSKSSLKAALQTQNTVFASKTASYVSSKTKRSSYTVPYFPQASTHENSSGQVQRDKEILTFIHDYFQLDRDLLKLYEVWGRSDPVFNKMKDRFSGIRILRQDPWETLVS